jgi:hypothetical protein
MFTFGPTTQAILIYLLKKVIFMHVDISQTMVPPPHTSFGIITKSLMNRVAPPYFVTF